MTYLAGPVAGHHVQTDIFELASAGRVELKALAAAVQACDIIASLGSHEWIQGDVSPDNLIWAEEQVYLIDFQTARRLTVSCLLLFDTLNTFKMAFQAQLWFGHWQGTCKCNPMFQGLHGCFWTSSQFLQGGACKHIA